MPAKGARNVAFVRLTMFDFEREFDPAGPILRHGGQCRQIAGNVHEPPGALARDVQEQAPASLGSAGLVIGRNGRLDRCHIGSVGSAFGLRIFTASGQRQQHHDNDGAHQRLPNSFSISPCASLTQVGRP